MASLNMPTTRQPLCTVPKVWGKEVWIVNNDLYCGKILYINAGACGSLHYHKIKYETFHLRSGHITIRVGDVEYVMLPGMVIDLPPGTIHQFRASIDSEIWEFSTKHDDEDTYRLSTSSATHQYEYYK